MTVKLPEGWHTLTPRIFAKDAQGLVGFLKRVFDATGVFQPERPAEILIGDSLIMISGTEVRDPMPACLYVYVEDADATYRRAIEAGATSLEDPRDVPYGDRRAMVKDSWDNIWQIATRK
jgi:PhnB protein